MFTIQNASDLAWPLMTHGRGSLECQVTAEQRWFNWKSQRNKNNISTVHLVKQQNSAWILHSPMETISYSAKFIPNPLKIFLNQEMEYGYDGATLVFQFVFDKKIHDKNVSAGCFWKHPAPCSWCFSAVVSDMASNGPPQQSSPKGTDLSILLRKSQLAWIFW